MPAPSESARAQRWRWGLSALLVGAVLLHLTALLGLVHHPAPLPGSAMGDTVRGYWGAWLVAAELPGSPLTTTRSAWPEGMVVLPVPLVGLLAVSPVTMLLGPAAGMVALVVGYSALAGAGGAVLARVLGAGPGGAVLSGAVLMTWPLLREVLSMGIYEYLGLGWGALCLAALVQAARGGLGWGPVAGLLYLIAAFESGYYGVLLAVGAVLAVAAGVRSLRGLGAVVAAGVVVLAGTAALGALLGPALPDPLAVSPHGAPPKLTLSTLELTSSLWDLRPSPTFRSGPLLHHWVLGLAGLALAPRRLWWLGLFGALGLLVAVGSPLVQAFVDLPPMSPIQYLRRFVGPAGLAFAACAGVGLSVAAARWWPGKEWAAGAVLAGLVYGTGALTGQYWGGYPLLWQPPIPAFAEQLVELDTDGAYLVYPQQVPDTRERITSQPDVGQPTLRNPQVRLLLQAWLDRPMRHYAGLGTSHQPAPRRRALDRVSTRAELGTNELAELHEQGLRHVLIDRTPLTEGQQAAARQAVAALGGQCEDHDAWEGVTVCELPAP